MFFLPPRRPLEALPPCSGPQPRAVSTTNDRRTPMQVAVLGAGGTMGQGMARNIARAGIDVQAWNRSREKAEPLAGDGISVRDEAAKAVAGSAVVITILSDGD